MFIDKPFQIAFLLSLIIHGAVLMQGKNFKFFPAGKKEKQVEIRYIKDAKEPLEARATGSKETLPKKAEPLLKLPPRVRITADKRMPPPPFVEEGSTLNKKIGAPLQTPGIDKPAFAKPDVISLKKKVTLPAIGIEKINNPTYISYYQIVREKIKRAAYQNYKRSDTGEVFLSFVISRDGYLKDTRLSDEKSSPDSYLREIALRSIKNASPFPDFPRELDYPQLSFNVVISFEME